MVLTNRQGAWRWSWNILFLVPRKWEIAQRMIVICQKGQRTILKGPPSWDHLSITINHILKHYNPLNKIWNHDSNLLWMNWKLCRIFKWGASTTIKKKSSHKIPIGNKREKRVNLQLRSPSRLSLIKWSKWTSIMEQIKIMCHLAECNEKNNIIL